MRKNLKLALLAGANLVVNTSDAAMRASPESTNTSEAAQVNALSMISIEKTFLEIPSICKARNAAFDPVIVDSELLPSEVDAIHSALDLTPGALS